MVVRRIGAALAFSTLLIVASLAFETTGTSYSLTPDSTAISASSLLSHGWWRRALDNRGLNPSDSVPQAVLNASSQVPLAPVHLEVTGRARGFVDMD